MLLAMWFMHLLNVLDCVCCFCCKLWKMISRNCKCSSIALGWTVTAYRKLRLQEADQSPLSANLKKTIRGVNGQHTCFAVDIHNQVWDEGDQVLLHVHSAHERNGRGWLS